MTHDPFRPRPGPAQAIYDAFQIEASKRKTRPGLTWIDLERGAVQSAANEQARQCGWPIPTAKAVELAECCACGHVDYGSKWAHYIVDHMRKEAAKAVLA